MPIHRGVFIPCITSFGSPEQIEKWYPLAAELYIVGTYAQTELGHGMLYCSLISLSDTQISYPLSVRC